MRNLIFLKFLWFELFAPPGGDRNPLARILQDLQLLVLENTDHSKPPNSQVISYKPSRLKCNDELQS